MTMSVSMTCITHTLTWETLPLITKHFKQKYLEIPEYDEKNIYFQIKKRMTLINFTMLKLNDM